MTPHDLAADLPAPRDDEPAALRDDIVDELRDHLECALRREELKTSSEPWGSAPRSEVCGRSPNRATSGGVQPRRSSACQRVLDRFGDPRTVARKLWWDAMRERIMGQRISIMLQAIMAGAVIAMCVIVYQSIQQSAHTQGMLVTMLNKTQQELLQSQREANAQLIERLAALAKQSEAGSGAPTEWNPLTVQCLFDAEDGPPAAGVKVVLSNASDNPARIPTIEQLSSEDGAIDFGKVLYGQYSLTITAPNGMQKVETVSIMPGQAKSVTIVCPKGDGLTTVTPRLVPDPSDPPPAELDDEMWYYVRLLRKNNGFQTWQRQTREQYCDWLIGPQGQVLDASPLNPGDFRQYTDQVADTYRPRSSLPPGPLNEFIHAELLISKADALSPLLAAGAPVRHDVPAEPGTYTVVSISPCLPAPDTSEGMRLLMLASLHRDEGMLASMTRRTGRNTERPTFTVTYDEPATVDIALNIIRFAEFDRVLKAAPGLVAWRFNGRGMDQVRSANDATPQFAQFDILGLKPPTGSRVLSGVDVIEWTVGHGNQNNADGSGFGLPLVTAIVLVTPAERDALNNAKRHLAISLTPENPGRTELTPDIVRALQTPEPQPASTDGAPNF
jgi:hypothetical protein